VACVSGTVSFEIGEASGAIASGLFRLSPIDWPTWSDKAR
jgi:hypothetical protein